MSLESIEARIAQLTKLESEVGWTSPTSDDLVEAGWSIHAADALVEARSLALIIALADAPELIAILRRVRLDSDSICPTNPLDVHAKGLGPEHCVSCLWVRQEKLVEMLCRVEWSAGCSSGCCETRGSCPICRANSPDAMKKHGTPREEKPWRWGPGNGEHQNDCALKALLQEK